MIRQIVLDNFVPWMPNTLNLSTNITWSRAFLRSRKGSIHNPTSIQRLSNCIDHKWKSSLCGPSITVGFLDKDCMSSCDYSKLVLRWNATNFSSSALNRPKEILDKNKLYCDISNYINYPHPFQQQNCCFVNILQCMTRHQLYSNRTHISRK